MVFKVLDVCENVSPIDAWEPDEVTKGGVTWV